MNLIPRLHNELVSIIFQPHQITLSHIQRSKNATQLHLHAYTQIALDNLELEKLVIYNPTRIKAHINTFLSTHNINNAFILCALSGPGVFERYISLPTAHAQPNDFNATAELKNLNWEYTYVYATDTAQSMYYVCGITPQMLLQYQLLAVSTPFNVLKITTKRMALHNIYKYMYGAAFRQSQFALDMMQHNNMIEYIFSQDTLGRIVHIPGHITVNKQHEITNILSACGLISAQL